MITKDFNDCIGRQIALCKSTLIKKAGEYATEDRLHNFKTAAIMQQCSPIQALAGMMAKHTVSIYDLCKNADGDQTQKLSIWSEKIMDHINYLLLLMALIEEDSENNF